MPKIPALEPQIDWELALVLERMRAKRMDQRELATRIGWSYDSLRKIWQKPPNMWPDRFRRSVFRALGISAKSFPPALQEQILQMRIG